ncbi:rhodanese-like domain-containing protein [Aureibaculum sp. 2210JD6-5]|uniref:rhodanese-like domain-containing protein n=1 Tax=Aureibaculum sp. 2210JD6-5 TaxID=3103957 RepID=UPI002AAD3632|nr:rhodanese-like domain-containing protein [Aureibaculum sp. 2210JD6-5]MDY7393631.1 rhodanese-like domain-containing protein [Aureibaculum sp. 2210JD6-5]
MKKIALLLLIASQFSSSQKIEKLKLDLTPPSKVSFDDFKALVNEVESHRAERLINLDEFLKMSQQENVVILDTRSDSRFEQKHIKGSIHLDFTDFTQKNLRDLIPDTTTKILIYCNNNFDKDPIHFATKAVIPAKENNLALALNIPTYINLYGYGYMNVYELSELVDINDKRIEFEGTAVRIND